MYILTLIRYLVLILVTAFIPVLTVQAESVRYFAVDFPVDEIRPVDESSVKIKLFGDEALVAKDKLAEYVAKKYLVRQHVKLINRSEVIKFANNAAQAGAASYTALAWTALLEASNKINPVELQALQALEQEKIFSEFVKLLITRTNQISRHTEIIGWLLCAATDGSFEWLRGRVVSFVYINETAYKQACQVRYLDELQNTTGNKYQQLIDNFRELFGEGDGWYLEMQRMHTQLQTVLADIKEINAVGLPQLIQLVQDYPEHAKFFAKLLTNKIHQRAQQAIAKNEHWSALLLLSYIDQDWRTSLTHDLVLTSIKALALDHGEQLLNERTGDFLYYLALKDLAIKSTYLNYLQKAIEQHSAQNKINFTNQAMQVVLRLRPDPDAANDQLRLKMAIDLSKHGDRIAAQEQLANFSRPMIWIEWIQAIFAGVYFHRLLVWSVICTIFLLAVIFLYQILKSVPTRRATINVSPNNSMQAGNSYAKPNFIQKSVDPRIIEYDKLLKVLGLKSNASSVDIKAAYRKAVKMLHPDTNPNLSELEHAKFRQITEDQSRIFELRQQLGLD